MDAAFANDAKNHLQRRPCQHLNHFEKIKRILCLITMDETWIYHCDPELKQDSNEWGQPVSSVLKQDRSQKWAKHELLQQKILLWK